MRAGRVRVDGVVCRDPELRVPLTKVRLTLDDEPVEATGKIYLMINKPRGLVTTMQDPQGRETVYRCLDGLDLPHVSPVGRLDKASEGLLLMTNDTVWAQRLLDPSSHLDKTYHVQIDRVANDELMDAMLEGIEDRGERLAVKSVRLLRSGVRNSWLEVLLDEGRNRQIRRILQVLGAETLRLVRVAIGDLELGDLPKGSARHLTASELGLLGARTATPKRSGI